MVGGGDVKPPIDKGAKVEQEVTVDAAEEDGGAEGREEEEAPAKQKTAKFPYPNETRIENCRYCTHDQMVRLVAGPQTGDCSEIGAWTIYALIALGIFLTIFFMLLGILYYSVVLVAILATAVVAYWSYLYYGPHWEQYDKQAAAIQ